MSGLLKYFVMLCAVWMLNLALAPTANAVIGTDETAITNNSDVASLLESAVGNAVLTQELSAFAYAVYMQGRKNPDGSSNETIGAVAQDWVTKHKGIYCSPFMDAEKNSNGFNCSNSGADAPYTQFGDIKTSVLLGPTTYSAGVVVAAQDVIRNIISPNPSSRYKSMVTKDMTNENMLDYSKYMANQASMGPALYALTEAFARRAPGNYMGINSGTASTTSLMAVMENETTRRFLDSGWIASINGGGVDQLALTKEMVAMQAVKLWMDYQMYLQNERMEVLLAAMLAKSVNASITQDAAMSGARR